MKKVLILTAENTGHGHKSIAQSIHEQFKLNDYPVDILEIDSFALGGRVTEYFGRVYDGIAVNYPWLWKIVYKLSNIAPSMINRFIAKFIQKNFIKLIEETKPDFILSIHACFVGSVNLVLDRAGIDIPVVPFIADIDAISHLWGDKRSTYSLCPTENAKQTLLKVGVDEDKVKVMGFPSRDQFNHTDLSIEQVLEGVTGDRPLRFFIMNGSQGTKKSAVTAKLLLDHFDCHVTIVAGRNKKLKGYLEKVLTPTYQDRVDVLGFINNVDEQMLKADILILRASPNVITEAVNLCRPIIITGALSGQEEKNPDFVAENDLGMVCKKLKKLPVVVNALIADDGKRMREIYESQLAFRKPKAAEEIVSLIYAIMNEDRRAVAE